LVVHRSKQISGLDDVLQGYLIKQRLSRIALPHFVTNRSVVGGAVLDGLIEDRGIGGEPGHRQFVDVGFERTADQEITGNIVEPQALAQIV
jgi:hypothetical protein